MSYIIIKPDELYHYGILGQKWGIRRFQNPDGSLTEAGKKRYFQSDSLSLTEEGKRFEEKAYNKLYGKNKYSKQEEASKAVKDMAEYSFLKILEKNNSKEQRSYLEKIAAINMKASLNQAKTYKELINKGQMFTKEYFDIKYAMLRSLGVSLGATQALKEIKSS